MPQHADLRRALTSIPVGAVACCAGVLAFGIAIMLLTGAASQRGTDYFYYYCVSRLVVAGHADQIYNLHQLGALERHLAWPVRVPGGVIPNVYPPFFALLLAPFAALPYSAGYVLWLILSCLLFGAALYRLLPISRLDRRTSLWLLLPTVCSLPALIALLQGQVSMLLLALVVSVFIASRRGHDAMAGAALGCTLIKPQYVLPFLILFVLLKRWRLLAVFAATTAVLFVAPLPFLGPGAVSGYAHSLASATHWGAHVGGFAPKWNRSFSGFTQLLLPSSIAGPSAFALDLAALVLLARVVLRGAPFELAFGLCTLVALLVSQHVLIHDLVLLVVPAAVLVGWRSSIPVPVAPLLAGAYCAVTAGFWLAPATHVQLPTLGMCALAAALVVACDPRAASPALASSAHLAP